MATHTLSEALASALAYRPTSQRKTRSGAPHPTGARVLRDSVEAGTFATRRRVVEVHSLADEICIFEDDRLIARHPLLEGRRQRSLLDGHRRQYRPKDDDPIPHGFSGELVTRRSLDFYAAVAHQMATSGAGA